MLENNYKWQIVEVPPNLPIQCRTRSIYDDRSLDVPCDQGSLWLYVWSGECVIANAVFGNSKYGLFEDSICVLENDNSRILTAELVAVAARRFGRPVVQATG